MRSLIPIIAFGRILQTMKDKERQSKSGMKVAILFEELLPGEIR
jgi:hypothetical protein